MIGRRLGRWELVEKIGAGGMAKVFLAKDLQSGEEVALKLLSMVNNDERLVARMKRESQALARLCHPHVIRFHGVYATRQWLFYVMDYVPGMTLGGLVTARYVMEKRGVALDEGLAMAAQITSALVHAHGHGVLHRDIKPDNILIHEDGRAILTDFGLAKVSDLMTLTGLGQIMGTVLYMSPEQLLGKPMDGRADVYQLGLVLYELLTGELPLMGETAMESTQRRLREDIPPPSLLNRRIPPWLDALLLNCLKLHPARRHPSAHHLLDAIEAGAREGGLEIVVPDVNLEVADHHALPTGEAEDGDAMGKAPEAPADGGTPSSPPARGDRAEKGAGGAERGGTARPAPSDGASRGMARAPSDKASGGTARRSVARAGDDHKSWVPLQSAGASAVHRSREEKDLPVWLAGVAGFVFVTFLALVLWVAGIL